MSNHNSTNINNLDINQAIGSENYALQELSDGELTNISGGFLGGAIDWVADKVTDGASYVAGGAGAVVGGAIGGAVGAVGDLVGADTSVVSGAKTGGKWGYIGGRWIFKS